MGLDTGTRVGLLFGLVSGLSWFLFADEDLGSPVNSLVAGIIGFMVAYALASLIGDALAEHGAHHRRRDTPATAEYERGEGEVN